MATEWVDFAPDELNIKVPRGASWGMQVTVADTDLTGKTVYGFVRESVNQPEADYGVIKVTINDAPTGDITIGQDDAQIAGEYYVNMKDADAQPVTILLGLIALKEIGQKVGS